MKLHSYFRPEEVDLHDMPQVVAPVAVRPGHCDWSADHGPPEEELGAEGENGGTGVEGVPANLRGRCWSI